jgi:hypothetical protein
VGAEYGFGVAENVQTLVVVVDVEVDVDVVVVDVVVGTLVVVVVVGTLVVVVVVGIVVVVVGMLVVGSGTESERNIVSVSKSNGWPAQSRIVLPPVHCSVCGPSGPS